MAVLTDVGAYLVSTVTDVTLVAGTNLFYGRLPDDPDICVALFETGGSPPTSTLGADAVPLIESPRVQVMCRAPAYADASTLSVDVWKQLQLVANDSLSSTLYQRVNAVQSPFALERDSRDRLVMACNYQVTKNV